MHKATKVLDALLDGREVTFDGYWPLVLNEDYDLCHVIDVSRLTLPPIEKKMLFDTGNDTITTFSGISSNGPKLR